MRLHRMPTAVQPSQLPNYPACNWLSSQWNTLFTPLNRGTPENRHNVDWEACQGLLTPGYYSSIPQYPSIKTKSDPRITSYGNCSVHQPAYGTWEFRCKKVARVLKNRAWEYWTLKSRTSENQTLLLRTWKSRTLENRTWNVQPWNLAPWKIIPRKMRHGNLGPRNLGPQKIRHGNLRPRNTGPLKIEPWIKGPRKLGPETLWLENLGNGLKICDSGIDCMPWNLGFWGERALEFRTLQLRTFENKTR